MTARYLLLEARRTVRNRRFLIFTLVLPVGLFLIYAAMYTAGQTGGVATRAYLMASMATFGAMVAALSTGTRIALERDSGWNRQLRLTPLRPAAYLVAKAVVGMLVALPAIVFVYAAGAVVEHVELGGGQWLASAAGLWLGVLPFAVLGILIGYVASPDSSQPVYAVTFMGLSLLGGIWIPVETLPHTLVQLAHLLPSYWLGLIARSPLGGGLDWVAVPVLAGWTVLLAAVVAWRFRSDTARS